MKKYNEWLKEREKLEEVNFRNMAATGAMALGLMGNPSMGGNLPQKPISAEVVLSRLERGHNDLNTIMQSLSLLEKLNNQIDEFNNRLNSMNRKIRTGSSEDSLEGAGLRADIAKNYNFINNKLNKIQDILRNKVSKEDLKVMSIVTDNISSRIKWYKEIAQRSLSNQSDRTEDSDLIKGIK